MKKISMIVPGVIAAVLLGACGGTSTATVTPAAVLHELAPLGAIPTPDISSTNGVAWAEGQIARDPSNPTNSLEEFWVYTYTSPATETAALKLASLAPTAWVIKGSGFVMSVSMGNATNTWTQNPQKVAAKVHGKIIRERSGT